MTPGEFRTPASWVALRPATPADREFLLAVYGASREEELGRVAWAEGAREAFLAQQFDAQDAWWRQSSPETDRKVVEVDGAPAGRLYVARREGEIRVVDVALLPAFRGRGVGSALLAALAEESDRAGVPLTIHVERFNAAALRFYARAGFDLAEDRGVYLFLVRPPGGASAAAGQPNAAS